MLRAGERERVARIRIGIIGWNYPEWKGLVYPEHTRPGDMLARYAERFPIGEAASTAYGMPKPDATKAWAETTPDGFRLSMKVPDWILKRSGADLAQGFEAFLARIEPLRAAGRLGTLVAQFHPSFARAKNEDRLAAFVRALPDGYGWAVELRHASWWDEGTYDLLSGANVTLVWSELGHLRTPAVVTSDALYLRLFGDRELPPPYDTKRRDATALLAEWAERVREAAPRVERVDILVSKFLEGYAPGSAETLSQLLDAPIVPAKPAATQTTLF